MTAFCLLFHLIHGSIVLRADEPDLCNGRDGIFIKNQKGCEFFFYCHNGQPLEAYCPGTFWFNEDSGICEDQKNVYCTLNDPVQPPIIVPEILDEPVNCPTVDTNTITFLASKVDCNRYYICYHGTPIRQQCIKEMHWNPTINKCDYPDNAKCQVKIDYLNHLLNKITKSNFFVLADRTISTNLSIEGSKLFPASRNVRLFHLLSRRIFNSSTMSILLSLGYSKSIV